MRSLDSEGKYIKRHRSFRPAFCLFSLLRSYARGQTLQSIAGMGRMTGGFHLTPSDSSNRSSSLFAASWPWSPTRSTPRPQCSARCGYSNRPFQPGVLGSGGHKPAPGANSHRNASTEPQSVVLLPRCIAPHFKLDRNGAIPRNRCEPMKGGK